MNEAADFLFRCNPVPGWIYDRETLRFLAVNQAAIVRYGYSEDEFLGMTIADIRPAEDVPLVRRVNDGLIPGPQTAGRGRHTLKSGEIIVAEVRAFPVTFMERAAAIVTASDITGMARFERAEADHLRKERETAALLAMAGRVARFGGWRVDLLTDEVVWSDETAAIHEIANEPETLAMGINHYVPEHRPIIEAKFRACAEAGVPYDLILQIVTGTGRTIWVRAIGQPERDADGRIVGVWGAFQDVNEVVRAHARSESTQKRLAETLNSISEGFMVLDQEWRLTFLNRAGAEFLLRSESDLVGRILWDEFPEARGSQFEAAYRKAVQTGETVAFEAFFGPLDTWFEVRAHPTPEGLAVHFQDVTERRRSLEALRLSEERFRLVTTVTNDVIWDRNLVDDAIWWNEHMVLHFGHEPGSSGSGGFWESQIHPEDRPRVLARIHAVIDGEGTEWSDEYRFLKADGSAAHVIDHGLVIRDADGVGRRMVGNMSDVTARRGMEARLREAEKLEAVGKLTGGIAHDFNNLLTVIIGTVESLTERLAHDTESVMLAQTTAAAARRGAELTGRLLAFARQQPLEPQTTDVARLVTDFDPILRRTLSGDRDLDIVRQGKPWAATVDPGQLETALLNLVINARDAMPRGGRLTIEISNAFLDDDYARANDGVLAGDYVRVSVSDSGSGMPPGVASRAFEPFFTTKEVGKGSGLGLSMVYGFIKQSRGHVKICSEPDEGTAVYLYLPRSHDSVSTEPAASPAATLACGDERILVVEDDAMVREHVARQLGGLGYAVTVAFDGREALDRFERGETFDLLFTDIVMPGGMNGRELAVAARRMSPDLKVLFTSGYTENAIVHDGRLDPDVQLLSKPYRKRDLADRVRRIFDH
ncbi:MAG: PAS domain-containing protein [Brevundimonas sp.]